MNDIWKKLKHYNVKPMYFGLGFIQCKISFEERYHFYHPEMKPIVNVEEEIHDHRYDFISLIKKGSLTNKLYKFTPNNNGNYLKNLESCQQGKEIEQENIPGDICLLSETVYNAGEMYFMSHRDLHTVQADKCITRLMRTDYKQELSNVVRHKNIQKICPFSKTVSENDCWEIISELLKDFK